MRRVSQDVPRVIAMQMVLPLCDSRLARSWLKCRGHDTRLSTPKKKKTGKTKKSLSPKMADEESNCMKRYRQRSYIMHGADDSSHADGWSWAEAA